MIHTVRDLPISTLLISHDRYYQLFRYLRPNYTVYHARAVNLIWALENATKRPYVESIVAQGLTSPQSRNVQESYEAFGVFWRLTGDFRGKTVIIRILTSRRQRIVCCQAFALRFQ